MDSEINAARHNLEQITQVRDFWRHLVGTLLADSSQLTPAAAFARTMTTRETACR
jgi:hypothetical protein